MASSAMGQEIEQTTETTSIDDSRAIVPVRHASRTATPGSCWPGSSAAQTIPCFFSLLKNVLRGMPSSRAATLLLPLGFVQGVDEPLALVGDELGIPVFAGRPVPVRSALQAEIGAAGCGGGRRTRPASTAVRRLARTSADAAVAGSRGRSRRRPGCRSSVRQVVERDRRAVGQDDGPLEHVLQLADVARPVVGDQGLDRLGVEVRDQLADPLRVEVQEVDRQLEDVLPALAQGRSVAGR